MTRKLRTRAIHAGEKPDISTGASSPNIVMSSTFAHDEPLGFSINSFEGESPFIYSRWSNPTTKQLEEKLSNLEEAEECLTFSSGMAATSAVFFSLLSSGDHLVISNVNYPGTAELVRDSLPRMGIEYTAVDTSDLKMVEQAMKKNTRLVWVETPANPILRLTDIELVAEIAHSKGALLAVDSTFATPIGTRPITKGADLVVHSLTKYICGHGDALGGAVIGATDVLDIIRQEATVHFGGVMSPFNAWLIMRGMATLPIRMEAHQQSAMAIAEWLQEDSNAQSVCYPGLASHPQHELAQRQMDNYGGVLSFTVPDGKGVAIQLAKSLEVVHYAVSLGHHRSLIYYLDTSELNASSYHLEGLELEKYMTVAGEGLFRISVGLEDSVDIIDDLAGVLGK
ncbi:MAG TPA: cystathionine gamma-synthase [Gammaproteobacteria bacterium]|nr:cystathionine gamma-synthase [Gammaproteobacteria bacterium]